MRLPADWETESGSGYWSHLAHLIHKPCGFRTNFAYDLIAQSNNLQSPRDVVYGHRCSEGEADEEPTSDQEPVFLNVDLPLTQAQLDNLERAAADLGMPVHEVLALLAGRVQVESAGRVYLAGEDESGGEAR
ncbi:hypothetical protein [Nonomuraea basaltis]|uniref:hypothetical protein n=1 Tax=Nonomuraea basaltis TaxID=2495887 RepID=UPI00110C67C2|nr:hypothetical protein [Nonomuraea basaltis]TMR88605.1 hypothetical protein EJK15_65265 [Nonomuraea basaltis]